VQAVEISASSDGATKALERFMARILVALVAALCGVLDSPQQTRLDELIQNVPLGETVRITLSARRPLCDLPTVLSNSDLVVDGTVSSVRSEASGLPDHVTTTLVIVVNDMWLDRRTPPPETAAAPPARVVVRQSGGRIEYQGRFIEVQDNSFPILSAGTDVVLFLSKGGDGSTSMEIVDGPYGAFVKDGQSIRSLLRPGHELRGTYDGLDRDSFKSLVAKTLAEAR
jgi:hypothetical protein